jgi:hypothetical protein
VARSFASPKNQIGFGESIYKRLGRGIAMKTNFWKISSLFFAGAFVFTLASADFKSADAEAQPHMHSALSHPTTRAATVPKLCH